MFATPIAFWPTVAAVGFSIIVSTLCAGAEPAENAGGTTSGASTTDSEAVVFTPSTEDELANIGQPALREQLLEMAKADQVARSTGT